MYDLRARDSLVRIASFRASYLIPAWFMGMWCSPTI